MVSGHYATKDNGYISCEIDAKEAKKAIDAVKGSNIGMAVSGDESSVSTTYHVKDMPQVECSSPVRG